MKYKVDIDDIIKMLEEMKHDFTPVEKNGRKYNPRDKNGEIMINSDLWKAMDYNETINEVLEELYKNFIKPNVKKIEKRKYVLHKKST